MNTIRYVAEATGEAMAEAVRLGSLETTAAAIVAIQTGAHAFNLAAGPDATAALLRILADQFEDGSIGNSTDS